MIKKQTQIDFNKIWYPAMLTICFIFQDISHINKWTFKNFGT